ncbi:MAG: hypothetical protein AAGF20_01995 [Pseudomonadota bacterium]
MPTHQGEKAPGARPEFDNLMEDMFGLSVRAGQTMWDVLVRPAKVAEYARTIDWNSTYTPTVRLTFSILTLMLLLSFFWAGEASPFYQIMSQFIQQSAAETLPEDMLKPLVDDYFAKFLFIYPISYMVIHGLIGGLVRVWGKDAGYVVRLRLYFLVLSVGILFVLLNAAIYPFLSPEAFVVVSNIGTVLVILIYAMVHWRATSNQFTPKARAWRSVLLALIVVSVDLAISFAAASGAMLWTLMESA